MRLLQLRAGWPCGLEAPLTSKPRTKQTQEGLWSTSLPALARALTPEPPLGLSQVALAFMRDKLKQNGGAAFSWPITLPGTCHEMALRLASTQGPIQQCRKPDLQLLPNPHWTNDARGEQGDIP